MMMTRLAHGTESKPGAPNVYKGNRSTDFAQRFSVAFGDFISSCLLTDPKQVSVNYYGMYSEAGTNCMYKYMYALIA